MTNEITLDEATAERLRLLAAAWQQHPEQRDELSRQLAELTITATNNPAPGEAWRLKTPNGEMNGMRLDDGAWMCVDHTGEYYYREAEEVALLAPLAPRREQPRALATADDYEAQPLRTIVRFPNSLAAQKVNDKQWQTTDGDTLTNSQMTAWGPHTLLWEP